MEGRQLTKAYLKELIYEVNGAAIMVHKQLGPGLLESIYKRCMMIELRLQGIKFVPEKTLPIVYRGIKVDECYRCDLFIENCVVVELNAIENVLPVHEAQLLTYMQLLKAPIGLLINFNSSNIYYKGQKTYVNEIFRNLKDK